MSLRLQAETDLGYILEGDSGGFRWPISVTDPSGLTAPALFGFSNDVALAIDPDTGQTVSGRIASVALRISSLQAAGFTTLPIGIHDSAVKPWIVVFDDINGSPYTFKIREGDPDRALGLVTCVLEQYTP